jgi:hypothetical protein
MANNGGRPAVTRDNVIRGNTITGFGMAAHCIAAAPGVSLAENVMENNQCEGAEATAPKPPVSK